jgi:hypothetical protein
VPPPKVVIMLPTKECFSRKFGLKNEGIPQGDRFSIWPVPSSKKNLSFSANC